MVAMMLRVRRRREGRLTGSARFESTLRLSTYLALQTVQTIMGLGAFLTTCEEKGGFRPSSELSESSDNNVHLRRW